MQQNLDLPLPRGSTWAALARRLARAVREPFLAERARWPLWLPVCLGAGIALHFALPAQPPLLAASVAGLAALALLLLATRLPRPADTRLALTVAVAAVSAGFALATYRTYTVAAPVLWREGTWTVEGRVAAVEPRQVDGERLLLTDLAVQRMAPESTPASVRVTVRKGSAGIRPGDRLRLRARLMPPTPPALPGGFDFARQAWFTRLGAVGYTLGEPQVLGAAAGGGWSTDLARLRTAIARRIADIVPGPAGAMGAALLVGTKSGIDPVTWHDMQISGLAHILAVSGLHMALVAGTTFTVARLGFALIPWLALRWPAQKPAALVAISSIAVYLLLTGSSVPATRAFLMAAVALVAIIVDRNPFSLRLLAWAAIAVLIIAPESLLGASFQLSFAAVLALIAVHESLGQHLAWRGPQMLGPVRPLAVYVVGVMTTTLIAGLATTPFTAIHFQRIATYGVLANLVAIPLTSFIVMPSGLAALALMPFGLDGPFLWVMGLGIKGVLATAAAVTELPGASITVGLWPTASLAFLILGGLWLALWRTGWRRLGVVPIVAALLLAALHRPPDLVVDPQLGMAARRDADGGVTVLSWESDKRVRESWLQAFGVTEARKGPRAGEGVVDGIGCDQDGCIMTVAGATVSLARTPAAVVEDCAGTDLVIARFGPAHCPATSAKAATMLASRRLFFSGGIAVRIGSDGPRIETVAEGRGAWPWAQPWRQHRAAPVPARSRDPVPGDSVPRDTVPSNPAPRDPASGDTASGDAAQ